MDQNALQQILKHNGISNNKGQQYIWRTEKDEKVRSSHAKREGKIFSWENPPEGGAPGEAFGCRCWAEPLAEEISENINILQDNASRVHQMKAKIGYNLAKLEALTGSNVNSPEARELLLGTAITESDIKFRRQKTSSGKPGKALGLMQMEPETFNDIWNRYLELDANRKALKESIRKHWLKGRTPNPQILEGDDNFAIIMARVRYMYDTGSLPARGDIKAQAEYWRRVYNGSSKAGRSAKEYEEKWDQYIGQH